jgi:putative ABC transport system permease protein
MRTVRAFIRNPWLTIGTAVLLSIGVASSVAVFTIADAVLWHPVSFADPARLVSLHGSIPGQRHAPFARLESLDAWTAKSEVISAVHYWSYAGALVGAEDDLQYMLIAQVTPDLLSMLRPGGFRGRDLARSDGSTIVISDELWRSRFGGGATAMGQTLRVDGEPFTIVGIAPPGLRFPTRGVMAWRPYSPPRTGFVQAIARLRPTVTYDQAEAFAATTGDLWSTRRVPGIHLEPLSTATRLTRRAVWLIAGAAVCVLLIAVGNSANLLLADAIGRRHEVAVRRTLGATSWTLLQEAAAEAVLYSLIVGSASSVLAGWTLDVIVPLLPVDLIHRTLRSIVLDWRAVGFGFGVSLLATTAALSAVWRHAIVQDIERVLRGRDARATVSRNRFVIAQLAFTVVLLIGAGVLLNGFVRLMRADVGFDPRPLRVTTVALARRSGDFRTELSQLEALRQQVGRIRGVDAATVSDGVPPYLGFESLGSLETDQGRPIGANEAPVGFATIDESFFVTLRLPLITGRSFAASDGPDSEPVVIVTRALADALWPGQTAIGRRFRTDAIDEPWRTVVGVSGDVRNGGFEQPLGSYAYFVPRAQERRIWRQQSLITREQPGTPVTDLEVRSAVRQTLPRAAVVRRQAALELLGDMDARLRFITYLTAAFAAVALGLALLGILATFWCLVRDRQRELGIRLAIGADPSQLVAMVLGASAKCAATGLLLGLPVALSATSALRSLLYEVSPTDPMTIGAASLVLFGAVLIGAYLPAQSAGRTNPVDVLRAE